MVKYIVTRYQDFQLITEVVENWNYVGCLIALQKIVSWERVES